MRYSGLTDKKSTNAQVEPTLIDISLEGVTQDDELTVDLVTARVAGGSGKTA